MTLSPSARLRLPRRLLAVSAACAATTALAADPFFEDIPLVLTASRLAQSPLDAPAPVTVIDREMIEASGFTEVHDLLRLAPGFLVADWPNGSPTVANHGLGDAFDRRIKVMIDGRTVNTPLWGDTEWDRLPLRVDDIERIEVVRGPNGGAYGANAFQGVINIITRHPATEDGFSVISRLGKDGFYDHGVRLNSPPGQTADWRLSASRRHAINFRPHTNDENKTYAQERNGRTVANLQGSMQLSASDELRLQLGVSDGTERRGYPPGGNDVDNEPVRNVRARNHYLQLGWTRSFDANSDLSLQYNYQQMRVRSAWVIDANGDGSRLIPTDADVDASRHDLELQLTRQLLPTLHLLVGADLRSEAVRSQHYFDTRRTQHAGYWQTFGSLTWQATERLSVNLGANYEHHDYSGKLLSPRLALNYALSNDSALRLSAGKAHRAPSLIESRALNTVRENGEIVRVFYRAAQPVVPEEMRFVELGYLARLPGGVSVDVRLFRERYDHYLDDETCRYPTTASPNPSRACAARGIAPPADWSYDNPLSRSNFPFLNLGGFVVKGGEFSVDWKRPGWGRIVLAQAFLDFKPDQEMEDRKLEDSAPASTTSLLLVKDLPGRWRASLGYYHTHEMSWINDGGFVPKRDRYDLKLARSFGPLGADNEFALTLQSMGGRYADFHGDKYRHEPRAFASLRMNW